MGVGVCFVFFFHRFRIFWFQIRLKISFFFSFDVCDLFLSAFCLETLRERVCFWICINFVLFLGSRVISLRVNCLLINELLRLWTSDVIIISIVGIRKFIAAVRPFPYSCYWILFLFLGATRSLLFRFLGRLLIFLKVSRKHSRCSKKSRHRPGTNKIILVSSSSLSLIISQGERIEQTKPGRLDLF